MATATTTDPRAVGDRIRAAGPAYRLVAAIVLVGAAPLVQTASRSSQIRFGVIIAFGWIPVSGVLALIGRRVRHPAIDVLNLAADLALLGIIQVVLTPRPEVYLLTHLLLVAFYTYVGGRRLGFVAGLAGFVLVASVASTTNRSFDGFALVAYPITVAALVWMLDTAAAERRRATDRVVRLHEKSDAILTGVAEAVMVTSPDGRIGQWNRAAETTFGCSPEGAHGRVCEELLALHHDVRALDCSTGCAVLAQHEADGTATGTDVELWRVDATGQRQPLLATAVPVVDRAGALVEVVHSFRDITKLKQADEAKTLFLATTSHELKTPLTVIRGFSEMLLLPDNQMTDAEKASALRAIELRARQLSGIVDRLLLSSRIEAGRVDLVAEAVDAAPILEEQVASMRAATAREVELEISVDLPDVWADRQAFTTVVDHLLDNAVKYSPAGGAIVVTAAGFADYVEVAFSDEGIGMSGDEAAKCFERFWQAELSDVRRFGGTGIGLYIVRSLVEGMGGRIGVSSWPGQGSTFVVTLPRADRLRPARVQADATDQRRGDPSIIREYMRQLGVYVESAE